MSEGGVILKGRWFRIEKTKRTIYQVSYREPINTIHIRLCDRDFFVLFPSLLAPCGVWRQTHRHVQGFSIDA